jgi:hypothetical protein
MEYSKFMCKRKVTAGEASFTVSLYEVNALLCHNDVGYRVYCGRELIRQGTYRLSKGICIDSKEAAKEIVEALTTGGIQ